MDYKPSRLVERAWEKYPRCLAAFRAEPLRNPPPQFGALNDLGFFWLSCGCGAKSFNVFGYPQNGGFFACPLTLACVSCGLRAEVFDIKSHGYDAELGPRGYGIRGVGTATPFKCPSCACSAVGAIAGFSYQIEPIEEMKAEEQQHIQDFFDWFYLEAVCGRCGIISHVSDYECA